MSSFKRPEDPMYPRVYTTFTTKDKDGQKIAEYRIQDIPEEDFDMAINMLLTIFLKDEALSYDMYTSPKSVENCRECWYKSLQERVSLGCYKNDESNELVGMNVLRVKSKSDPKVFSLGDEQVDLFWQFICYTLEQADIYNRYSVDSYLSGDGLLVKPAYRGRGLATELLKARIPLMKLLGIHLTATSFTSIGPQKAAEKAGFEDVYVKEYEDLAKISPKYVFTNNTAKTYKIMVLKI